MQNRFLAGVYEVDITPPLGIDLAGYFNVRKADNILDNLYAKTVVLKVEKTEVAIVSCDICVIPRELVLKIRELASAWSDIPKDNIMISTTHTHTGPVTTGLLAGDIDHSYIDIMVRRIATGITMAKRNLEEAIVRVGKGEENSIVFNRRYIMKDSSVVTNPGKLNPNIVRPAGPVDPEILLVAIEKKPGYPIAFIVNYANHVDTIGGTGISSDYPGIMAEYFKEYFGNISVLFLNGAEGDINHIDVNDPIPQEGYREAKRISKILAGSVARTLVGLAPLETSLKIKNSIIKIPIRKPSKEEIYRAKELLDKPIESTSQELTAFDLAKGSIEIEKAYAQEILLLSQLDKDFEELELQVIALGDLVIVGIPGEPFVEIGLEIKKNSPFHYTGIVSLANGYSGYIPTEKAFEEGGYETKLARSSKLDKKAEKIIIEEAIKLIREIYT
ncbi:MAG: neutral/alkaline non-lysosomal ceramidase N-terminal domain-containing protein [bacterium]|nr:neutral/alkaline non-lysosomal ceramidase N-terminal domain-containing protein [bacterium]